ncbi:MAG TPA: GntR family transcriptional regulator, partial [Magnetospirillum sp.]|nr:GntR family transcriptional regulator [Magnetospirillum sp.]
MKLNIVAEAGLTIVEQVVTQMAGLIEARAIGAGKKLPSIRRFAEMNGISKSSVVEAYDRLVAEGLIVSRPKSGFFVSSRRLPGPVRPDAARPRQHEIDPLWMLRHSLELDRDTLRPGCGWLPPTMLPADGIRRALRAVARADDKALTDYGSPLGYEPLRGVLQRMLAARGVEVGLGNILLTD